MTHTNGEMILLVLSHKVLIQIIIWQEIANTDRNGKIERSRWIQEFGGLSFVFVLENMLTRSSRLSYVGVRENER